MTGDHFTYQRATRVSLVGLAVQCLLAIIMLIYGFQASDPGAMTASFAMLLGIPVWIALALVFHQHKLERLEALERDAYASSTAAQATVFEEAGTDQTVQAEKLAWMHRWFLPGLSIVLGAAFIGIGLGRYFTRAAEPELPDQAGWAIAIGIGAATVCFVFARFVAGMAKQKVWSLLHAGSASAATAAILGLLLALAHFIEVVAGQDRLLELLPTIMAFGMVALGAEVLLNFVLNLYRPRKPDEYPRPAFDSRVLAFIAAPDRLAESISEAINYQLGFNVSSTWFYQLLTRAIGVLTLLAFVSLWGLTCFTVIRPNEQGLIIQNGKLVGTRGPGLVFKQPWPFSRVETYPVSAITQLNLGSPPVNDRPVLWSKQHTPGEEYYIVQASRIDGDAEGDARSNIALLAAEIPLQFVVTDIQKYKNLAQDGARSNVDVHRHDLLEFAAHSAVIEYLGTRTVAEVLGAERQEIVGALRERVQAAFDDLDAGVRVHFVGLAGVHPEMEVAKSFINVVAADFEAASFIEESRKLEIDAYVTAAGSVEQAREISAALGELDELNATLARMELEAAPRAAMMAQRERVEAQELAINGLLMGSGGTVAETLSTAQRDRWERSFGAWATAERNKGQTAAYAAAPAYFMMDRYLRAVRSAASDSRVWLTAFENTTIELDVREEDLGTTLFRPEVEEE